MTQGQSQVKLLRIAEFAKVALTTPRALRLWQEKGLLEPDYQDKWTGYRYYRLDQIEKVLKIKWLQELGLGLKEIGEQGRGKVKVSDMVANLDEEIKLLQAKRDFILSFNKFLNSRRPALKKVWIGGWQLLTYKVKGSYYQINDYVKLLWEVADRSGAKFEPLEITFYQTPYFSPLEADLKIGLIIKGGRVKEEKLPSGFKVERYQRRPAYRFSFLGPYRFLAMVYRKLDLYFRKNKLPISPPVFEMYLKGPFNTDNEYHYLTHIFYPVGISV